MTPDPLLRGSCIGPDGRARLGPAATRLLGRLDRNFACWGEAAGAEEYRFAPVVAVSDLARIDYFENFPHLASPVSALDLGPAGGSVLASGVLAGDAVDAAALTDARFVLPSAACYSAYFALQDSTIERGCAKVTTIATCFRREERYEGLRRLFGFTMREIICVGTQEAVIDHLQTLKARIAGFLDEVCIPYHVDFATDPFFDPDGARGRMQKLFPTKEEFLYDGKLAIASVNFHRNFFGERCGIRLPDGSAVERRLSAASDWAPRSDENPGEGTR
jgi:hypothetical protein